MDRGGDLPLHEQIERMLRDAIRDGQLAAGATLPSSRGLAAELGVSRGVVTSAYDQLAAEGYLQTRQGAPVRVAPAVRAQAPRPATPSLLARFAYEFSPRLPDLAGFPRDRWLRSLRSAWRQAALDAVGYGDPRGVPELREALSDYLGRVRGAAADPEHLLICTGFRQGLSLACRWLRANGIEHVALEEPGWHAQRLIVEEAGLEARPIPVDAHGIDVGALGASGADVVVVTPAHQFPTGAVLSRERVGALQGLAPDRVLYIGSASKRLTPGMRLAWMLPPSWLSWALISAKAIEDAGSEIAGQLALANFIARGELERHLRRMRLRYARRRETLLSALARELPDWRPSGSGSGLYVLVDLPRDVDEPALLTAAARHGVGIEGLSLHSYTGECQPGLVVGYGYLAEPSIERGVRLLAGALGATSGTDQVGFGVPSRATACPAPRPLRNSG
jgi:GntR family transcriptional regulator/MocR family aminotransferase